MGRWFESSTTEVENEEKAIANRRARQASLHEADMLITASGMGVHATALHDITVETQKPTSRYA